MADENKSAALPVLSPSMANENELKALPVGPQSSGKGLPYAPENWPKQGDIWAWRVGARVSKSGFFLDRYLFPPERFGKIRADRPGLISKVAAQEFIKKEFPNVDLDTFFASFIWRIPCDGVPIIEKWTSSKTKPKPIIPIPKPEPEPLQPGLCKARNKSCLKIQESKSLENPESNSQLSFPCDICCSEPGFCPHCCCILCGRTVDLVHHAPYYFRCGVCGHGAHIKCAHRCFLAGVVGGSIGLDGEYYCRRCDCKADLVEHFESFFRVLKGSEKEGEIERVLRLGLSVLSGVKREMGKNLYERIDSALVKMKCGIPLGEILQEDMMLANNTSRDINNTPNDEKHFLDTQPILKLCKRKMEFDNNEDLTNKKQEICDNGHEPDFSTHNKVDQKSLNKKLGNEIQQALENFKKLHEQQFKIVEEKLFAQKDCVLNLHRILELERCDLADPIVRQCNDGETYKALVERVVSRLDELNIEEDKLHSMLMNFDLIMQKSKDGIKEYFGVEANGLLS